MADTSGAPACVAFCATGNGAESGASSRDCAALGPAGMISCASVYEPQQYANAAAASKVAR
ncbi:hypothetical protein WS86_14485 [Burkholderia savannae]|nr:hypothetical protein WS86_14485 [Burkholderia savannae]